MTVNISQTCEAVLLAKPQRKRRRRVAVLLRQRNAMRRNSGGASVDAEELLEGNISLQEQLLSSPANVGFADKQDPSLGGGVGNKTTANCPQSSRFP
jgi:hypothetical protein